MKIEIPTVIKFDNGDIVIALLDEETDIESQGFIDLLFPIKVVSDLVPQGQQIVEKFSLQPWIALSDEIAFRISTKSITMITPLREDYEAGYKRMVENFFTELNEDDTIKDNEETMFEYMEALKHNKIN